MPEANELCWYCEAGLSQQCAKSRLKPARALTVKMWKELVPICRVP
jgi:hypothetical protein